MVSYKTRCIYYQNRKTFITHFHHAGVCHRKVYIAVGNKIRKMVIAKRKSPSPTPGIDPEFPR